MFYRIKLPVSVSQLFTWTKHMNKDGVINFNYKFFFGLISAGAIIFGSIFWLANVENKVNASVISQQENSERINKIENRMDAWEVRQNVFREEVLSKLSGVQTDLTWIKNNLDRNSNIPKR